MKKKMDKEMKRMTGKMMLAAALFSLLCGSITGCGGNLLSKSAYESTDVDYTSKMQSSEYGLQDNNAEPTAADDLDSYEESVELSEQKIASDTTKAQTVTAQKNNNQKIIKKYNFNYETENFEDAYSYLKEQIERHDGYISSSEIQGTGYRRLYLTARIPAETSDEFAGQLGSLGTLISQSESAEDVTLQYTDTESRIASLKTEQERLNALLEKADSLENIISLEERLTEVRYELENYMSQKKLYDDLISYSTVNIVLEEVNYTVEVDDSSIISRISTGLKSSFRDIKDSLTDFVVWLVVSFPYLVIWAVVILIVVKVIQKFRKRRKAKKILKESLMNAGNTTNKEERVEMKQSCRTQKEEIIENEKE